MGLGKLKNINYFIGTRTRDLPACIIAPQPIYATSCPIIKLTINEQHLWFNNQHCRPIITSCDEQETEYNMFYQTRVSQHTHSLLHAQQDALTQYKEQETFNLFLHSSRLRQNSRFYTTPIQVYRHDSIWTALIMSVIWQTQCVTHSK
jgi:CMP-N-acetylneuraminic acid synthetase